MKRPTAPADPRLERKLLKSAKGAAARHQSTKGLAGSSGGALSAQPLGGVVRDSVSTATVLREFAQGGLRPDELRDRAFRKVIRSIPKGKVATYGQVAAAAGYPRYHRAVARLLRTVPADSLPWQRVVGAGGAIKLRFEGGAEQRLRLEMEGVRFRGKRVNLDEFQHQFRTWELDAD